MYEIFQEGNVYYLCYIDDTSSKALIGNRRIFASSHSMPETLVFDVESLKDAFIKYESNRWMLSNYVHRKAHISGFADGLRYSIDKLNAKFITNETFFAEVECEEISVNERVITVPKIRNGHINIIKIRR